MADMARDNPSAFFAVLVSKLKHLESDYALRKQKGLSQSLKKTLSVIVSVAKNFYVFVVYLRIISSGGRELRPKA